MRPADLLECIRQMSMEDRLEMQRLLSKTVDNTARFSQCPNCLNETYEKIDRHPAVTIYRCTKCQWEDQIVKR
jgi:ribosomal protein L37AE/L43A